MKRPLPAPGTALYEDAPQGKRVPHRSTKRIWITSPLGLSLAGPISDWLGLQIWYMVAGVLAGASVLVFLFVPAARNIQENANGGGTKAEQLALAQAEA